MSHFPATPTPTPRELTADEKGLAVEAPFLRAALSSLYGAREASIKLGSTSPVAEVREAFITISRGIGDVIQDSGLEALAKRASDCAREVGL